MQYVHQQQHFCQYKVFNFYVIFFYNYEKFNITSNLHFLNNYRKKSRFGPKKNVSQKKLSYDFSVVSNSAFFTVF